MKFFDAFSGIGGFHKGITEAIPEAECLGHCEIDKYASNIYQKQFGGKNYGDIRKVDELPEGTDLLCGGFPCQAFSIAGKRKGFEDTRGTLFFELARLLRKSKPKYFLFENVKGLLSHDDGKTIKTILATLGQLNYDIQGQVMDSQDWGLAQHRERVFFVGHLRGTPRPKIFPLRQSLQGVNKTCDKRKFQQEIANALKRRDYKDGTNFVLEQIGTNGKGGQGQRVYSTGGLSTTIAAKAGGQGAKTGLYAVALNPVNFKASAGLRQRSISNITSTLNQPSGNNQTLVAVQAVLTPDRPNKRQNGRSERRRAKSRRREERRIRRLTPLECERLQGFPDNWTKEGINGEPISDSQRYKMLGNAVSVPVVKAIMERF